MAARRSPGKVQVSGHARVTVAGLRAASRAGRKVSGLDGGGGGSGGSASGDLGRRLKEAGQYVADLAKGHASWSAQCPPAIKVRGGATGISIVCGAPPAYPNEIPGVRHPTFGHDPWVTNQHRPFFAPAADEGADHAAEIVAGVIDDWAADYGFR